jgi:HSP20 family molecular chaperone IbpA
VVKGKRRLPDKESEWRPLTIERLWGSFERRFMLPAGARADKITARYAEGVLELKLAADGGVGIPERKEVQVA